jgi:hypothetical protein
MVVRLKHLADNLNTIVHNYWNRVALDGNPWTLLINVGYIHLCVVCYCHIVKCEGNWNGLIRHEEKLLYFMVCFKLHVTWWSSNSIHHRRNKEILNRILSPIAVAELSEARTVFARSNTAIVGSNPTEAWMFVCVLCAFFLFLHGLRWDSQPT